MEYVYPIVGLVAGACLVGLSVATAFVYTPYTTSLVDSTVTAFTGVSLQIGDFIAVSSVTAILFDVLAIHLGVRYPIIVPCVFAYVITHVVVYYSCLRITDLQSEPLDPDFDIRQNPMKLMALSIPGALILLAPRDRDHSNR
ncbi:hypothetical protein [Halopelagius longus]|uniref:DUF8133 domain-containing protein n=1 Tax=Halopelagius longus TaxID=1236180 RepID=A0A1H0Z856_9EURY|nr:hypothetical protein [Halopelagius longus]RDI72868.1 hypothetical protein DWB78_14680 [Halopelagius longus]SDQ23341.1 hypothetical protein SAMN05216278_1059 [Halopelagius longus]